MENNPICAAYVAGRITDASHLSSHQFQQTQPGLYMEIRSKLSEFNLDLIHTDIAGRLLSLISGNQGIVRVESRIKSPSSVYHSLSHTDSNERTILEIRDLVGFRIFVDSSNFGEYYSRALAVLHRLLPSFADDGTLSSVLIHNSTDHPLQQVHLHCQVDGVFIEIKLMNEFYFPVFKRTLYPLWEGFVKHKFSPGGIINPLGEIDRIWGLTCAAFVNKEADLMTLEHRCQCGGHECRFRSGMSAKQFHEFYSEVKTICRQLDVPVNEKG